MMIEIKGLITIIKAANEMGAKRVEIDADGSVAIEWPESNSVTISSPCVYFPSDETPETEAPGKTPMQYTSINDVKCTNCKYTSVRSDKYPCVECSKSPSTYALWEPKEK